MTAQKSFKRRVRMRMEKTGESYTAARASLLNGSDSSSVAGGPTLTLSEEAITRRTGRGWEEWFDLIDASPVADAPHPEIAAWLIAKRGVPGWDAQSVTVSYEKGAARPRDRPARRRLRDLGDEDNRGAGRAAL